MSHAVSHLPACFFKPICRSRGQIFSPSSVSRFLSSTGEGKPSQPSAHQGRRNRVVDGLLTKVTKKRAATCLRRVVDQPVDHVAGRHLGAKLIKRLGYPRPLFLGFAFKLLAGAHGRTSIVASRLTHLPEFDEWSCSGPDFLPSSD